MKKTIFLSIAILSCSSTIMPSSSSSGAPTLKELAIRNIVQNDLDEKAKFKKLPPRLIKEVKDGRLKLEGLQQEFAQNFRASVSTKSFSIGSCNRIVPGAELNCNTITIPLANMNKSFPHDPFATNFLANLLENPLESYENITDATENKFNSISFRQLNLLKLDSSAFDSKKIGSILYPKIKKKMYWIKKSTTLSNQLEKMFLLTTELNLSFNLLDQLPQELAKHLPKLTTIDLSYNPLDLKKLEANLSEHSNLKKVIIKHVGFNRTRRRALIKWIKEKGGRRPNKTEVGDISRLLDPEELDCEEEVNSISKVYPNICFVTQDGEYQNGQFTYKPSQDPSHLYESDSNDFNEY